MNQPKIEVIEKPFDLDYYRWQFKMTLHDNRLDDDLKVRKMTLLVQRAYEQGIIDAKKDKTYFDDY